MLLIVEKVGEDPEGASLIMQQRAPNEDHYLRDMLLDMAAHLDDRDHRAQGVERTTPHETEGLRGGGHRDEGVDAVAR